MEDDQERLDRQNLLARLEAIPTWNMNDKAQLQYDRDQLFVALDGLLLAFRRLHAASMPLVNVEVINSRSYPEYEFAMVTIEQTKGKVTNDLTR